MTREQLRAELDKTTDWEQRQTLFARLGMANRAVDDLVEITPELAAYEKWHGHLTEWRQILSDRLLAGAPNAMQGLTWSIKRIDHDLDLVNEAFPSNLPLDDLMREAGYVPLDAVSRAHGDAWLGSLPKVERKLAELRKRRDRAQLELDQALRDTEDPVRESDSVENHVS
jgi:hypothetical protein